MNTIPEEFQIKDLLNQDTYLINGELKVGGSNFSCVFYDKFYRRICTYNIGFNSVYGEKKG
jgi:hypothetical protein